MMSIKKYDWKSSGFHFLGFALFDDEEPVASFQRHADAKMVVDGDKRDWKVEYFRPFEGSGDFYLVLDGSSIVCVCREYDYAIMISGEAL
jgi:hypothetical protein